jgi:lysophospholipase L1-like esterase
LIGSLATSSPVFDPRGSSPSPRLITPSLQQAHGSGIPTRQSSAVVRFNEILGAAGAAKGIAFVPETFAISQAAGGDRSLVAYDGLHPSGAQYARWVAAIQPVVERLLLPSGER